MIEEKKRTFFINRRSKELNRNKEKHLLKKSKQRQHKDEKLQKNNALTVYTLHIMYRILEPGKSYLNCFKSYLKVFLKHLF